MKIKRKLDKNKMSGKILRDLEIDEYEFNKKLDLEELEQMEEKIFYEFQEKRRKFLVFKKELESLEHVWNAKDSKKVLLYLKYIFDKVQDSECGNYLELYSDNSLYFLNKTTMEIFSYIFHCPDKDCKDCCSRTTLKFCLWDFSPSQWREKD